MATQVCRYKSLSPRIKSSKAKRISFAGLSISTWRGHAARTCRKTATTSALDLYEADESLPVVGEYNIILDSHDHPVCVTQTKVVETVPFDQVSQEHAYHEGEDDRSPTMWRQGHEQFFKAAYSDMGRDFNFQIPCVCEVFERID